MASAGFSDGAMLPARGEAIAPPIPLMPTVAASNPLHSPLYSRDQVDVRDGRHEIACGPSWQPVESVLIEDGLMEVRSCIAVNFQAKPWRWEVTIFKFPKLG